MCWCLFFDDNDWFNFKVNHLTNISLHELYLNDNEIQAIEDNAFEMLFKLWLLDLSENDILGKDFAKIYVLFLNACFMTYLHSYANFNVSWLCFNF